MNFIFSRRFWPLFVTQFLGAANDNMLKTALLVMIVYQSGGDEAAQGGISNLASGLFILPYFLFSAFAGQLADKCDKSKYSQTVKLIEILLMLTAAAGFYSRSLPLLLAVLFGMGAQSTFFSPAKYSLLPTHLSSSELLSGNAWIGGGTYVAILIGVVCGNSVMALEHGALWCGGILLFWAVAGYLASCRIPPAPPVDPDLKLDWNLARETWKILKYDVFGQRTVRRCILSVSMFWLAGSLYVTQVPIFTRSRLGGSELVCMTLFVIFSAGVGLGALLINKFLDGETRPSWISIVAVAFMALPTLDLALLAFRLPALPEIRPDAEVFTSAVYLRAAFDMLLLAAAGGAWSVPLQSLMQYASDRGVLARVIAGNNIVNSFAMTAGAVAAGAILGAGMNVGWVFVFLVLVLVLTAVYTARLMDGSYATPEAMR